MLIIGAKGFAKEVLEVLYQINPTTKFSFFDNVTENLPDKLYHTFNVLKTFEEASQYFKDIDKRFVLGLGDPQARFKLAQKFISLGGQLESSISPYARIGHFGNYIGKGVNIMTGCSITNDISIGDGCLINLNCTLGHDIIMGEYCELSPGVHISGNCTLGKFCNIGTGAVILPKITLGENVTVGAGAVVTKNVADNTTVVGIPAKPLTR